MFLSRRGRFRLRVLGALALVASLWLSAARAEADFCDSQVIRDYTKVLERLPAIPPPPLDQHPSFAPAQVLLLHQGSGPLQVGGGERGFTLIFTPYEESNSASRRLDWQVTSRLVELDRRGHRVGLPRTIERHVKRLRTAEFDFKVSGKPAIYRLEIVFENESGKRLARYGGYFRVLRPSLDVDFFLNGTSFHRSEQVQAWLVNRGVASLSFGLGKTIEYNDGTAWTKPPVAFPGGPVPAIGLSVGPGVKTSCWKTTIPTDAALGVYRFATEVDYSLKAPGESKPLALGAEFTVME
jgi:hypothetical protein